MPKKSVTSASAGVRKIDGQKPKQFRCGFAAIIGRPNVGKSTLLNRLVGQKVSIVTSKPQTTRNRIQGIVNQPGGQLILIDTPGLHRASTILGRQMLSEIEQAMEGVDVLVPMLDASAPLGDGDRAVLDRTAKFEGPAVLLLNKIDRVPKEKLLPLMETCSSARDFAAIIPVSALNGDGVAVLLAKLFELLPIGEPLFPADQVTDQPERFLVAEIVREKAMAGTKQEVPHSVAVLVDTFEETPKLLRIRATIYVEREGQKGILIGRAGAMLKHVGTAARLEIEKLLGSKVFLELYVKVHPEWRNNPAVVQQLDWRAQLEHLSEIQQGQKPFTETGEDEEEGGDGVEDDEG
jgi:GTP-binding protein Era